MLCMMGRLGNLSSTKEFSLAPSDKHQLLCTKTLTKVKNARFFFLQLILISYLCRNLALLKIERQTKTLGWNPNKTLTIVFK